ncbi:MAG: hypothetical protein ABJ263_05920 [Tateyamaria sp.]|uniref:hypothetical protein n=1 Tax=Tateyamaria sp. TaxID=1929288 RepID=UPI00326D6F38
MSVTVVAALGVAPLAMACAFDLVKPERTAIDWIVDTETLVLAHAKPGNRFAFEIATVLVGPPDPSPIPHLVNSTLRRKLANDPEGKVLFAQSADGQWRRVAYVDVIFRDVLSTALANRDNWRSGMTQDRVDFVAGLQGSPDPRHRALLIGELDKVPYAQLRDLDLRLSDTELIADLWSPEGYAFQAIRALLLGMTGTDEARSAVSGVVERAMDGGTTKNLGAFAAAYIELGGTAAVRSLSNGFFGDASTSPLVLEQIVTAMSVHRALADDEGQREIDAAILDLVQSRPDAASIVAQQFGKRSDWTQVDALEPLMRNHKMTTKEALWTVSGYVVNARSTSREISVGSKKTKTFSQDPASSSSNVTTVGN